MKRLWVTKLIVFISLMLIVLAPEALGGARDHQGGFFLRLSAGPFLDWTKYSVSDASEEISGYAFDPSDMNVAIGGIVFPNLALHGVISGFNTSGPDIKVDGASVDIENLGYTFVGVGMTYYFMPQNLYISGAIGMPSVSGGSIYVLDPYWEGSGEEVFYLGPGLGVAFDIALGKEWWIGSCWALGVAGAVGYHSESGSSQDDIFDTWSTWSRSGLNLNLRLSATYNKGKLPQDTTGDYRERWVSFCLDYANFFAWNSESGFYHVVSPGMDIRKYEFTGDKNIGSFMYLSFLYPTKVTYTENGTKISRDIGEMNQGDFIFGSGYRYRFSSNDNMQLHGSIGVSVLFTGSESKDVEDFDVGVGGDIGIKYDMHDIFYRNIYFDIGSIVSIYFDERLFSVRPYIGIGINVD